MFVYSELVVGGLRVAIVIIPTVYFPHSSPNQFLSKDNSIGFKLRLESRPSQVVISVSHVF